MPIYIGRKQTGFTLTEMMVVVAILGVLTAIILPMYNNHVEKTRLTQAKTVATQLQQQLQTLKLTQGEITAAEIDIVNDRADNLSSENGLNQFFNITAVLSNGKTFINVIPTDTDKAGLYLDSAGQSFKCDDSSLVSSHSSSCKKF